MPLSEQEQRLLEEMERSLYHNDADYVAGAGGRRGKPTYSRIGLGILLGVVGVAVLITGVGVQIPVVGVFGFALMFVGVLLALSPARNGLGHASDESIRSDNAKPQGGSFLPNTGDRYDNRSDDRDE